MSNSNITVAISLLGVAFLLTVLMLPRLNIFYDFYHTQLVLSVD